MSDEERPVRSAKGKRTHLTVDLRRTYCGRVCEGWHIVPDAGTAECLRCAEVALDIAERGN